MSSRFRITHLTASTFYGGPERQMLGLAQHLTEDYESRFLSFAEGGACHDFIDVVRRNRLQGRALTFDAPRFRNTIREITAQLRQDRTQILCCHGYKAGLLGRIAARRVGIKTIAVSRGWTAQNLKIKVYEFLDRLNLRWMDHVVCVSNSQAEKVLSTGIRSSHVSVIHNSIDPSRFQVGRQKAREDVLELFGQRLQFIVGGIGRLSGEKGFDLYVRAALKLTASDPRVGFLHCGDGPQRERLQKMICAQGMQDRVVLAGTRSDVDTLIRGMDVTVLPSYTEGLPNAVLESMAAGTPVIATAVGGTPELITHNDTGCLIPPGQVDAICNAVSTLMDSPAACRRLSDCAQQKVAEHFTFQQQAEDYSGLFQKLLSTNDQRQQMCVHS